MTRAARGGCVSSGARRPILAAPTCPRKAERTLADEILCPHYQPSHPAVRGALLVLVPVLHRRVGGGGDPPVRDVRHDVGHPVRQRPVPWVRDPETEAAAVGLAGEIAALDWLKAHYDGVDDAAWVSGYRNLILGDGLGNDALGYDLIVEQPRTRLYFEVKSSLQDPQEFVLTSAEIARAGSLKKRERYYILYIAHVLNREHRRIYQLPNPLDPRHAQLPLCG